MKRKTSKEDLTSPHLKELANELLKVQKAKNYLESEKKKLIKNEEKIRKKISNEKEILRLRKMISTIKSREV